MASVTYEQAEGTVGTVLAELGQPDWLQGVGIEPGPKEGYVVSVRILPGVAEPDLAARRTRFAPQGGAGFGESPGSLRVFM